MPDRAKSSRRTDDEKAAVVYPVTLRFHADGTVDIDRVHDDDPLVEGTALDDSEVAQRAAYERAGILGRPAFEGEWRS